MTTTTLKGSRLTVYLISLASIAVTMFVVGISSQPWFVKFSAVSLATCFIFLLWSRARLRNYDLLEADVLYLVLFGLYLVVPTIIYAFLAFDPQEKNAEFNVVACVLLALLSLTAGLHTSRTRNMSHGVLAVGVDGQWALHEAEQVGWILVTAGLVLLAVLVSRVGVSTYINSVYVESYAGEQGLGLLTIGGPLFGVGVMVLFLARAEPGKKVPLFLLILFLLFALAEFRTGRRRVAVEPALGLLALYHFYVRPVRRRRLVVGSIVIVVALVFVGRARSYLQEGFWGMLESTKNELSLEAFYAGFLEFDTVHLALTQTIQTVPAEHPYRYGATILESFEDLVPLKWHPNRPLAPSQKFALDYDPETAAAGGGYGYSLLAEGYLNFGLLGVVGVSYFEGVFLASIVNYRRQRPDSKGRLLLYGVTLTLLISLLRGDLVSLLKGYVIASLIPAVLCVCWLGRRNVLSHP